MFCSLFFASFLCFPPQPIVCEPKIYDQKATSWETNTQAKEGDYDKTAIATAYTLSKDETDNDPCMGAGNHNLCELQKQGTPICASRGLPLHTKIIIEGYGLCEILDRTSLQYADRIDILFPTKTEAFAFGKKELRYRLAPQ
jgi:3D (Asp-Asp-Asp) domain-containing protein